MSNLMELCLSVSDRYRHYFVEKLRKNALSSQEINAITNDFDFRKEIILSLNKKFRQGRLFADFCAAEGLSAVLPAAFGFYGNLYMHQEKAIQAIRQDACTVVSTGTGSGKTESFLIPIVDYCLAHRQQGIKAVIIYPMNALAQDQVRRIDDIAESLEKLPEFEDHPITFGIFTGNTPDVYTSGEPEIRRELRSRREIIEKKPDILITNYVMLDRLLTNPRNRRMFDGAIHTLKYVVLDELHTYRGTKGAHIKYLLLRLREQARRDLVQIGCSATLSRNTEGEHQEGYIGIDNIDTYINTLFSVDANVFIRPEYAEEDIPVRAECSQEYQKLKIHEATRILRAYLQNSSHSLSECLSQLQAEGLDWSEYTLKQYLTQLFTVNEQAEQPVLDFRVHLFLRSISGMLKRCIHCGRYHTGGSDVCDDCGSPVFSVYKRDYHLMVGHLEGKYLYDCGNIYMPDTQYVLINTGAPIEAEHSLTVTVAYTQKGALLQYNPQGKVQLIFFADGIKNKWDVLIYLGDAKKREDIYQLIRESLLHTEGEERKILAFIDNRESAARYAALLNDQFLSQFFLECMALVRHDNPGSSISDLYPLMLAQIGRLFPKNNWHTQIADVKREFDLWFAREISLPSDEKSMKTLALEFLDDRAFLSDWERKFVNILLLEKIVDSKPQFGKGNIIQFYLGNTHFQHIFYLDDRDSSFSEEHTSALSFSKNAIKYKAFVAACPHFKDVVDTLVRKNIVLQKSGRYYTLNPQKVTFENIDCTYDSFEEIRRRELLFSHAHTSEVKAAERTLYEKGFSRGELNVLVATSTLEMGIDIGGLSMVYLLGVPPMPSNYAQRGGRAGRRNNRFALIVTMCSEYSNHDMYYFHHPKEMIEGTITPPSFDADNPSIQQKHGYALLCDTRGDERDLLRCRHVLGVDFSEQRREFLQTCLELQKHPLNTRYDSGWYPEYVFRRDEVVAVNPQHRKGDEGKDYELARRELERAYKEFVPDREEFLGEQNCRFTVAGDYDEAVIGSRYCRTYRTIYCEEVNNIKKDKQNAAYDCGVEIVPKLDHIHPKFNSGDIVSIWLEQNLPMAFVNEGIHTLFGSIPFRDGDKEFIIRYPMGRNAILFGFDDTVVSERMRVSLCMALDRTIKDTLGLDESESGWIIDEFFSFEGMKPLTTYMLFYDKNGSGNVNTKRIFMELEQLMLQTYDKLRACPCEGRGGCYMCMKGYQIQRLSPLMDKNLAIMFSGYLCGKEKFLPKITLPPKTLVPVTEFRLKVNTAGKQLEIYQNDALVLSQKYEAQNEGIFTALAVLLQRNMTQLQGIRILARDQYVVEAVNGIGKVNSGQMALNLFRFYVLAYDTVEGVKY